MHDPVMVMGMSRSGTTLLAEMVHKGGTPMFSGDLDPRYDQGIKYERPLCQTINRQILGLGPDVHLSTINFLWKLPLQPIEPHLLEELGREVGENPWGIKNPRTTLTYPMWCGAFPRGVRLYVYRSHREVARYYLRNRKPLRKGFKHMRRSIIAWINYNEHLLENLKSDQAAGRTAALVRYEELMEYADLVPILSETVGLSLADARDFSLRRNKIVSRKETLLCDLASFGLNSRLQNLYRQLEAARVQSPTAPSNQ